MLLINASRPVLRLGERTTAIRDAATDRAVAATAALQGRDPHAVAAGNPAGPDSPRDTGRRGPSGQTRCE